MPLARRHSTGTFLLLAIAIGISVVVAEAMLRVRSARMKHSIRSRFAGEKLCTAPAADSRLIYTFRPNECGTNSHGYFDREHALAKPEGTFRIVIIGDSVAQGKDVGEDESFGRVLEQLLNTTHPFRRHEVIVLARMGYSTSQEIVLLEEEAFQYDPDLVIWSYCLNDPAHPVFHNANGELGRFYYEPSFHVAHLIERALFTVRERLAGRRCPVEYHAFLHCVYRSQVSEDLARLGQIAARENVPIAFVIHPVFEPIDTFADYSLRTLHEALVETAERNNLVAVDLLPAFDARRPDDLKVHRDGWYDPWHPNAEGHRITAEYIFEVLAAQGLV